MSEQAAPKPQCEGCGATLVCVGCDDVRPQAEDIYKGWRVRTPFGRWETVERVAQANEYAPVLIWTQETGEVPWRYPRYRRLDARRPEETYGTGRPELRAVELSYDRAAPMFVVATREGWREGWQESECVLVEARFDGTARGWTVRHRPDLEGEPVVLRRPSKAAARGELRRLGREYAKRMKVRFTVAAAR